MIDQQRKVRHLSESLTADDAYEAAGFVMNVILSEASVDDEYGNYAEIKPVAVARDEQGRLTAVIADITYRVSQGSSEPERVLVTA